MTELLYQIDSYTRSFDAQVLDVNEEAHAIQLDKTCLYPGGGGQPFDRGTLSIAGKDIGFTRARMISGEHWHVLKMDVPLPDIGSIVHGELDWEYRHQLMRTHTRHAYLMWCCLS